MVTACLGLAHGGVGRLQVWRNKHNSFSPCWSKWRASTGHNEDDDDDGHDDDDDNDDNDDDDDNDDNDDDAGCGDGVDPGGDVAQADQPF